MVFKRFLDLIKRKLGICRLCITLSGTLALLSLAISVAFGEFRIINLLATVAFVFFFTLFMLHVIAWIVRRVLKFVG